MKTQKSNVLFVLIHGMWEKSSCWDFIKKELEDMGFTCFAPNLKHHGKNAKVPHKNLGKTSMNEYAEDLEKHIENIRLEYPRYEIVLVGHSMGGLLVQMLLSRKPDNYRGGIMLTPAAPAGIFSLKWSVLKCFGIHFFNLKGCWRTPLKLSKKQFKYAMYKGIDKNRRRKIIKGLQHESGRAASEIGLWPLEKLINFLKGKGWKATTTVNFNLKHPKLFIGAKKDKITPAKVVKEVAERHKAEYKEVEGPHYVLENTAVMQHMSNWIKTLLGYGATA